MSVQALPDSAAPLDHHRAACAHCPAHDGRAAGYGCYDSINYPLPRASEQWLLDRLPASLDCTAGQFLTRATQDFGWDGAKAASMRARGDMFFESRAPLVRAWPELTISSDQSARLEQTLLIDG